jgi:hypothetical protein
MFRLVVMVVLAFGFVACHEAENCERRFLSVVRGKIVQHYVYDESGRVVERYVDDIDTKGELASAFYYDLQGRLSAIIEYNHQATILYGTTGEVASVVYKRLEYNDSTQTRYFYNSGKPDSSVTYGLVYVDSVNFPDEQPFSKVLDVTHAASYSFTGENVTTIKNYYRNASGFRLASQVNLTYDSHPIIPDPRVNMIMPMAVNNVVKEVVIDGRGLEAKFHTQYQYNNEGYPLMAVRLWSEDPVRVYYYTCAPRKKL